MILDNDNDPDETGAGGQAEGASGEVNTRCIELDVSLYNSLLTLELALVSIESIDASGLWHDVEEGCYIKEPALGLGSHE